MAGNSPRDHFHSGSLESNVSRPLSPGDSDMTADISSEDSATMSCNQTRDVNVVLNDVIDQINEIADHIREQGENEAANRFTHKMTNTLQELYIVIAPWDIEKCLMKSIPKFHDTACAHSSVQRSGSQSKQVTAPSPGTTWAAVAATEPATDKNGIIKFRPSDGIQIKAEQDHDLQVASSHPDAMRVVWVRPWTADRPLKEITKKMQNLGALYSIAYCPENAAVCIIFQQAVCASEFMHRCAHYHEQYGRPIFGADQEVTVGQPFPATHELARMNLPYMERRRLTFARAGLFNKDGVSQQQFREDIEQLVGPSNVELLWFFNSGNATVVFSAVPLSKLVREKFLQHKFTKNSPYNGVMVSYSHDPCERDMHLVSQIPGHPGYLGGASVSASGARARGSTFSSNVSGSTYGNESGGNGHYPPAHKRRMTGSNGLKSHIDDDGWETVKKRR